MTAVATKAAPPAPDKDLAALTRKNAEDIGVLTKSVDGLVKTLSNMRDPNHPSPASVFGAPHVRHGEDPFTSRGFSLIKMMGLITGAVTDPNDAKIEVQEVHNRLHKCLTGGQAGYAYGGGHRPGEKAFLCPLSTSYMMTDVVDRETRALVKNLMAAGTAGADPDEVNWYRKKSLMAKGYDAKALSWLNEFTGGALVAPPEQGELIELLRNKEALVSAGARTIPLPPQGRMVLPRHTGASTTYWVGEHQPITTSDINTGEVTLQAKKLAVLVEMPNELVRFASPAAEALVRDDMTKSLALGLDLAALEGAGGDKRPLGILLRPNIQRITSRQPGANGDAIVGEDIYRLVAAIEEANAEPTGFIMRPKTWYKYLQLRADAVSQGDRQGMFLFNAVREPGDNGGKPQLAGLPVTKSTQVAQNRTKGNASNLSYILCGMWEDVMLGMFGALEFSATNSGDTTFRNDGTWVKGILSADVALRHEAAFALMDQLDTTIPL